MTAGCGSLAHQALIYSSTDEFVATLAPFVREGWERGDRVFAATKVENFSALREELGADADEIEFHESAEWYRQPYRTLAEYERYVGEHANGRAVRVIGEPVWDDLAPVSIGEWARYESVINHALADANTWIICPYDASALPAEIVEHAAATHPELIREGAVCRSEGFVDPDSYSAELDRRQSAERPGDADALTLSDGDYGALRWFLQSAAERAGIGPDRVCSVVLAAHELATNAVKYGRSPARVHVWRTAGELVCEIEDAGTGPGSSLVGFAAPGGDATSGRGVWLARQLCDSLSLADGESGFAVRARWAL